MDETKPVALGITRLLQCERRILEHARVGLIANAASRDERGAPTASALIESGIRLIRLLSPEHGYDVSLPAGQTAPDAVDPLTRLPICSLYGSVKEPDAEMLRDLDALVYDLQDVGVRCYTYIWTMALAMRAAALFGKLFVVLDRPNPLDGVNVQGPLLDERFASFLGLYPIPLRYGLTAGELALLLNRAYGIGVNLAVVKMHGWRRRLQFPDTGLTWVAPSPAIVLPETAFAYAGTCLFEGTNLSEGRGTSMPFRLIGAPWLDPSVLKDLDERWSAGFALSPQKFTPTASKYRQEECVGIAVKVVERETADPIAFAVELLSKIATRHRTKFAWNEQHFDAVAGTDNLRRSISQDGHSTEDILKGWKESLRKYEGLRLNYLMYEG